MDYILDEKNKNYVGLEQPDGSNASSQKSGWSKDYTRKEPLITVTGNPKYTIPGAFTGIDRLIRIFDLDDPSDEHGFNFINSLNIEVKVKEIINGVLQDEYYEEQVATPIDNPDRTIGTHNIKLYKDYKDKKVEITLKQTTPPRDYKKISEDIKMIVEFDDRGKIKSGTLTQGVDIDEITVGGISAGGQVDNLEKKVTLVDLINVYAVKEKWEGTYANQTNKDGTPKIKKYSKKLVPANGAPLAAMEDNPSYNIEKYDIKNYDSINNNIFYVAMLNKPITAEEANHLKFIAKLKDIDTEDSLNGTVELIVKNPLTGEVLETKTVTVNANAVSSVELDHTYFNARLLFEVTQVGRATRDCYTYVQDNPTAIFIVETDDDGDVCNIITEGEKGVSVPSTTKCEMQDKNVVCTMYNELDYNFAINVNKLGSDGNPLEGVRIKTTPYLIPDTSNPSNKVELPTFRSALTNENGELKLKIQLPTEGGNEYYNHTVEFKLDEYYVPDNYIAATGLRIRVAFDGEGKVVSESAVSTIIDYIHKEDEKVLYIESVGKLDETGREIDAVNIRIENVQIQERPTIQIINIDLDNGEYVPDASYQITSLDRNYYKDGNPLEEKETITTELTDEFGETSVTFRKAHALRTIVYQIEAAKVNDLYIENDDIFVQVIYDEEGNIASVATVANPEINSSTVNPDIIGNPILINARNQQVATARLLGDSKGGKTIQIEIKNKFKPRFSINIKRENEKGQNVDGKLFKVELYNGEELLETVWSITKASTTDEPGTYTAGFRTDPKNYNMLTYKIYEQINDENLLLRGIVDLSFESVYGNNGTITSGMYTNVDYINVQKSRICIGKNYQNVCVRVDDFKIKINLKDIDGTRYNLKDIAFEIINSKNETNVKKVKNEAGQTEIVTKKTDSNGIVIETVGEVHNGKLIIPEDGIGEPIRILEEVTYRIKQIEGSDDYEFIEPITLRISFDEKGRIVSCIEDHVPGKYDVISTASTDNSNIDIDVYVKACLRNKVIVRLLDEDDKTPISNAKYQVKRYNAAAGEEVTYSDFYTDNDGIATLDLGSYKLYKNSTQKFNIKQADSTETYMMDDEGIAVFATYDDNGYISINSYDGELELGRVSETGFNSEFMNIATYLTKADVSDIIIDATNKRKTKMDLTAVNIINGEKIQAEFEIEQEGMGSRYLDIGTTTAEGDPEELRLYVGPYYKPKTIKYIITNTDMPEEYQDVDNLEFELVYDEDGKVLRANIPDSMKTYLQIKPIKDEIGHVQITIKVEPRITLGIDAVDEDGERIGGGIYQIVEVGSTNSNLTVTTSDTVTKHAILGDIRPTERVTYEIVERKAPLGYKYIQPDPGNDPQGVIGRIVVDYGQDGNIVGTPAITYGEDWITLKTPVDKLRERDIDIQISYEEIPEFKIIIDDQSSLDEYQKVKASFRGELTNCITIPRESTDNQGWCTLNFGEILQAGQETVTVSQTVDLADGYLGISDIKLGVEFDPNGAIIIPSVQPDASTSNYGIEYEVKKVTKYSIKLVVKNNPLPTLNIINVENQDETQMVESIHELDTAALFDPIQLETTDGKATTVLDTVQKGNTVTYTIKQTYVEDGYVKNEEFELIVQYDIYGNITPSINPKTNTFDVATVTLDPKNPFVMNLKIRNNSNRVSIKILDIDAQTNNPAEGATHYITTQIGDVTDNFNDIINNPIENSYAVKASTSAETIIKVESAESLANKRVVYTIYTPQKPNDYEAINPVRFEVAFDDDGNILQDASGNDELKSHSGRLLDVLQDPGTAHRINAVIGYGTIDFYRIVLEKEDSITKERLNDVQIDIDFAKYRDGVYDDVYDTIPETTKDKIVNGTLIESGVIELNDIRGEKIKQQGNIRLTLIEKVPAVDYAEDLVDVEIPFTFDVELEEENSAEDIDGGIRLNVTNVQIPDEFKDIITLNHDPYTKEIRINVKNNPGIKFKINKKDENGNALSKMKFDVVVEEYGSNNPISLGTHSTDTNGQIELNIPNKYADKTMLIKLTEHKRKYYQELEPIVIKAFIQRTTGAIEPTTLKINDKNVNDPLDPNQKNLVKFVASTDNSIEIEVVNELEESARPFSININKKDSYTNKPVKDAPFQVFIEYTDPETEETYKTSNVSKTDQDGKITINNLVGSGEITIEVIEQTPPAGYDQSAKNQVFTYKILKEDGKISKASSEDETDNTWSISGREVNINLTNKPEAAIIGVEKVQEGKEYIKIPAAKYILLIEETGEELEDYSKDDGMMYFPLTKRIDEEIHLQLREEYPPQGYKIDADIKNITLKFDSNGNIEDIYETNGKELDVREKKDAYVKITVKDKLEIVGENNYNILIRNMDKEDVTNIPVQGGKFNLSVSNQGGANFVIPTDLTDANGYATKIEDVNGTGRVSIKVENTIPGDGYRLSTQPLFVEFSIGSDGKIDLNSLHATNGSCFIDEENDPDTLRIVFESEKLDNVFKIRADVVDVSTGELITNSTGTYTLKIDDIEYTANLDEKGYVTVKGLKIPDLDNFEISIDDIILPPEGYEAIGTQTITATTVKDVFGNRTIDNAYDKNNPKMEIIYAKSGYIEVRLLYGDVSGENIIIDCIKTDKENQNLRIEGAKYTLTPYEEDGVSLVTAKKDIKASNEDGILRFKMPKTNISTTIKYELKETEELSGYLINENSLDLEITYDEQGNIDTINDKEVHSNSAEIILTDEQDPIPAGTYNIVLRDVDKEDEDIPIQGSKFNIYASHTSGAKKVSVIDQITDVNGYIPLMTPINGSGDVTIEVRNIEPQAPGYELYAPEDGCFITLHRDENTGFITDITSNHSDVVTAKWDEESNTVIITFRSVKQENKYSIKVNVIDSSTGERITDEDTIKDALYEFNINGDITRNRIINENGQIFFTNLDVPEINEFLISILEQKEPNGLDSIEDLQEIKVGVITDTDNIKTLDINNAEITQGENIEIDKDNSTPTHIILNLIYDGELYVKSDIYAVDDDEKIISRVIAEVFDADPLNKGKITVKEFIENLDTNATTLKLYDKGNNLIETYDVTRDSNNNIEYNGTNSQAIATEMTIKAIKGTKEVDYCISVVGDINGDGIIDLADVTEAFNHTWAILGLPGKSLLQDVYPNNTKVHLLAANTNGNKNADTEEEEIDLADVTEIQNHTWAVLGLPGKDSITKLYMQN